MGFIEIVNKYAYKVAFNQSYSFKKMNANKKLFEDFHVVLKIKDEFDLMNYEILYCSLMNMKSIQDAYDAFVFHNYDMLSYLKYDEKVRMFNADLKEILVSMPMFYDEENETHIYLPMYEAFLNRRIIENYEMMQLKQHKEYLNSLKFDEKTAMNLYGEKVYLTHFSPLKNVYEDERHICIYYDTLKKIYFIKKDTKTILNEIIICDHYRDDPIEIEHVCLIAEMIENYKYNECLNYLFENEFINEKTYKKIMKKYK